MKRNIVTKADTLRLFERWAGKSGEVFMITEVDDDFPGATNRTLVILTADNGASFSVDLYMLVQHYKHVPHVKCTCK